MKRPMLTCLWTSVGLAVASGVDEECVQRRFLTARRHLIVVVVGGYLRDFPYEAPEVRCFFVDNGFEVVELKGHGFGEVKHSQIELVLAVPEVRFVPQAQRMPEEPCSGESHHFVVGRYRSHGPRSKPEL